MTIFRSQTDEQLAARHDRYPWASRLHHSTRYASNVASELDYLPRVETVPTRDPRPYVEFDGGTRHSHVRDTNYATGRALSCRFDPRPEFARPPVNRVLTTYRERGAHCQNWLAAIDTLDAFGGYVTWDHPDHVFNVLTFASPQEIEHARKVLTRLAAFTNKEN